MREDDELERFVRAHERGGVGHGSTYDVAISELRAGHKETHWIWYVFPQAIPGQRTNAQTYQIRSRDEAAAYVAHDVLWARYIECLEALTDAMRKSEEKGKSDPLIHVMGSEIDRIKTLSSLTLFCLLLRDDDSERTRRFRELVTPQDGLLWGQYPLCPRTLSLDWWS